MKKPLFILTLCTALFWAVFTAVAQDNGSGGKTRLVVLTDYEADPDDNQSLVRLLTYANQLDIEALIATTSIHQPGRVRPEMIMRVVEAYGKVRDNLMLHEPGWPTQEYLAERVSNGPDVFGMAGVGEGKDTPGSEMIISILEKPDERPLWVTVWGGPNTLAQALWKIRETKSAREARRLYDKLRVYTISDQDDSGPWIRGNFPSIFFIVTPGYTYGKATWRGISSFEEHSDTSVITPTWLAANIQQGHGPLGAAYPDTAYSMEGDTPTYLGLIPNGLNVPGRPDLGGWGGRYEFYTPAFEKETVRPGWPTLEPETRPIWTNAQDSLVLGRNGSVVSNTATIWRWRTEFQNDFAARIGWSTLTYAEANHPPVVKLGHPEEFTVKAGEMFWLSSVGTYDPDGDSMSHEWIQYYELGSYKGPVRYDGSTRMHEIRPIAPEVTKPETIHFVLKVTDKGSPALTRYKRVVVTVVP